MAVEQARTDGGDFLEYHAVEAVVPTAIEEGTIGATGVAGSCFTAGKRGRKIK